jgi:hypothetical protein
MAEAAMSLPPGLRRIVLDWSRARLISAGAPVTPAAVREAIEMRALELGAHLPGK